MKTIFQVYIYFGHILCVIIYHVIAHVILKLSWVLWDESYVIMSYVIILVLQMITLLPFYPNTLCDTLMQFLKIGHSI
jgi:hypothetical protein